MSKPVKQMITDHFRKRFDGVDSACVVDMTGLDVHSQETIRTTLRKKNARVQVVKNSLARRAFADTPLKPLGEALDGACALVTGGDSAIDIAKALVDLTKEHKKLTLKRAILDGDPDLLTVDELSKMKSRAELLGEVAGCIAGPGRRIAGAIGSPAGKIAGCLKAIADKAEAA